MIPIRDTIPSRNEPIVTWALIAVNALVFVYEVSLGPEQLERFVYDFGVVPARDWAGVSSSPAPGLPFLTSMFLHGGWGHLIGNMWMLWIFGDNVEDRMGPGRFLLFYLLTGVAASVAHCALNSGSTLPTVGASGAISGVLGAYFALFPYARVITVLPVFFWPYFFDVPAVTYLFIWFVSQLLSGTLAGLGPSALGGVAWWAHVGGFAVGALAHPVFLLPRRRRPREFHPDEYAVERAWAG
ncbi:MAG: rhomboid family intramembrane serine protease [Candidatus Binatia bacterium]